MSNLNGKGLLYSAGCLLVVYATSRLLETFVNMRVSASKSHRRNPEIVIHKRELKTFSQDEKDEIARAYVNRVDSIDALSKKFNCTETTIQRILSSKSIPIRDIHVTGIMRSTYGSTVSEEQFNQVSKRFKELGRDVSKIPQIAQELNLSERFIISRLKASGAMDKKLSEELSESDKEDLISTFRAGGDLRTLARRLNLRYAVVDEFIDAYIKEHGKPVSAFTLKKKQKAERLKQQDIQDFIMSARATEPPMRYETIANQLESMIRREEGFEDFNLEGPAVYVLYKKYTSE